MYEVPWHCCGGDDELVPPEIDDEAEMKSWKTMILSYVVVSIQTQKLKVSLS